MMDANLIDGGVTYVLPVIVGGIVGLITYWAAMRFARK
jgi:uncharacterized membrane protein YheB (UPF0754 family)